MRPACVSRICHSRRTASSGSSRARHERRAAHVRRGIGRRKGHGHDRHADLRAAGKHRGLRPLAGGNQRRHRGVPGLHQADRDAAEPARAGRLGDPATLRRHPGRDGVAQLAGAAHAHRRRGADAGRARRHPHRSGRRRGRAALAGVGGDLDPRQAGPGEGLSGLGAAHRRRSVEISRLPGLSLRAAGAWRAGRLARDHALRHRGQPAGLARLARAPQAVARGRAPDRGIPRPHRAHRLRPMVPGARRPERRRRRPGR